MAWLPFLEPRPILEPTIDARINFLRTYGEHAERLAAETGLVGPQSVIHARIRAWMQAAEIALVADRAKEGRALLNLARGEMDKLSPPDWQTMQAALIGGVVRDPLTRLTALGIEFHVPSRGMALTPRGWNASAAVCRETAGPLIASALASGEASETLTLLSGLQPTEATGRLGYLAVANAAEAGVLPMFGLARDDDGRFTSDSARSGRQLHGASVAFLALHQRYANRLRLMQANEPRWRSLTPRVPLLDWTLLLIHLALVRQRRPLAVLDSDERERQLIHFLHGTAVELG